ncbi:MAG: hypothetical protein O3A13_15365 [Proteobacteria bacterium]|nr:hypothetical protein [Pseudomonadota bacterium]MDA0994996.1 hypothetical protein [Pseudomonadota bacterium]
MTGSLVPADKDFLSRFEQCALPEREWTHLAHIRVAWICFRLSRSDEAIGRICKGILRYNTEVLHRRHKYHETVTIAFAHIISDRMREGESWIDFVDRIDDLLDPRNPILLSYYSANRLFSDEARIAFVQPDLKNIPQVPGDRQEI